LKRFTLLAGGLGNQLFQYANCLDEDVSEIVFVDFMNNARKNVTGNPDICDLSLPTPIKIVKYRRIFFFHKVIFSWLLGCTSNPNSLKFRLGNSRGIRFVIEGIVKLALGCSVRLHLDNRLKSVAIDYLDNSEVSFEVGYFQNNRKALKFKSELSEIRPRKISEEARVMIETLRLVGFTGIHVRRGDYLTSPRLGLLDYKYFRCLLEDYGTSNDHILVFSDSRVSCEDLIPDKLLSRCRAFPRNLSATETLYVMSEANFLIMSNSSLSWWSGFFADCKGSKVIAPTPWFITELQSEDLYLPNWSTKLSIFA
jgi:hypothetical protein